MWADFATHFSGILQNLEDAELAFENCDSEEEYQSYLQNRLQSKAKCQVSVTYERQQKMKAVSQWLAVGRRSALDHKQYQKIRTEYPSTGNWILEHEHVKPWMIAEVAEKSVMWMTGVPGADMSHHYIVDYPYSQ
jgi:hypothetical protein